MEYKEVYRCEDGTEFKDEWDAMEYCVWKDIEEPLTNGDIFLNYDKQPLLITLENMSRDAVYGDIDYIDIRTSVELDAVQRLAKYNGWWAMEQITDIGYYHYDEDKEMFVREM